MPDSYLKSPIFLAVLEIRYKNNSLKEIEQLLKCKTEVTKLFPFSQKQVVGQLKLDNLIEGQPKVSLFNQKVDCLLYRNDENQTEFTISLDRFNYRQSGNYSSFEEFTKNIKTVWEIHHELLKGITIIGISLRCFNKIEIRENVSNPTDYFNISIQVGEGIVNDTVSNFTVRYIAKNIKEKRHSIVSLSLESTFEEVFPFILDLDVHDENEQKNDLKVLWKKFEKLRIEKDNLFNQILTEKTKLLFK